MEETLYEVLSDQDISGERSLLVCRELQKILLNFLEESSLVVYLGQDGIRFKGDARLLGEPLEYFNAKLIKGKRNLFLEFGRFKLNMASLRRFQTKQTPRQRSDYIAQLNERLNTKNLEISKLVKAKSYLMNFIAHEIRNPLNTIIGYSELLEDDPQAIPVEEIASIFSRQASDIKRLVDEILDFSKMEMNKLKIQNEILNVKDFADDFAKNSALQVQAQGLNWSYDFGLNDKSKVQILADGFRLKQILNNFLSNAVKFTGEGEVKFKVSLAEGSVVFAISDTGPGFDPEFKDKIFSEFSQESTEVAKSFGGSGLGLNIAMGLAKLMNSNLDAQSTPGQGACFEIKVPLHQAQVTQSMTQNP